MGPVEVPEHFTLIRDAVVDHANGKRKLPEGAEDLCHWLFWESDAETQDFALLFKLTQIDLSDDALRSDDNLDAASHISDKERISFARQKIRHFKAAGSEDLVGAHNFLLRNSDGSSTVACCLTESHGQAGLHPTWLGFFPTVDAFQSFLKTDGYLQTDIDPDDIDESTILKAWTK